MSDRVRSASFYLNNVRLGFMQNFDVSLKTGDTLEITDQGVIPTDGTPMGTAKAAVLVPVAGTRTDILKKALAHADLKIALGIIDGSIIQCDARIENLDFKSEVANGKLTGDWSFLLFNPQITG